MATIAELQHEPPVYERTTLDHISDDDIYGDGKRPGFDVRYLISAIRANIVVIGAMIAAALALAVAATMLQTPRYTAGSKIQINDQSERVIDQGEDSNSEVNSAYDTDRFLQTQIDVLNSRGLATRVVQRLKLIGNDRFYHAMGVRPPNPGASPEVVRDMVIGLVSGNKQVNLPRNSRIATISFESTDPAMSADVANAYAEEFIQANLQRRYDSSAYARSFIYNQLNEAKQRLENSERALNEYARAAGLIRTRDAAPTTDGKDSGRSSGQGQSVTTASLLQLNGAANEARAARIVAEGRWRAISSGPLLSSREVLANGSVQQLFTLRAQVEAQLQEESARHLGEHPNVLQLRAQLASINAQLNQAANNVRASVRSDYDAAVTAERALEGQVNTLKSATLAEQDRSVQYNLLAREADTNRTLYDGLLQRFKELNAAAGISASNISIVDRAEPPLTPSSPKLFKNIAVALLLSLAIATIVVFLKTQFDDTVRVPEEIEQKLELPLLGVVPRARNTDPDEALDDPKSPITEAYNSLRSALLYSTSEGLPKTILITSSQPAEGKTTTSFAIGMGLARMGRRVVLVDLDLRRPTLHRRISNDNASGMTTLLTGHDPAETVVEPSGYDNLSLITSGPIPPSPTELISSARMEAVLDELASKFDVVIIDSPPILGLADAPLLSALVDGVVFVIESDRGRRGSLKASLRRLRTMRPMILGAVLTMFDASKAGNRYSEYYGYEYYTYSSDKSAA